MHRVTILLVFVLAVGCGDSSSENNDETSNSGTTALVCEASGDAVAEAIRSLDRSCSDDVDCRVVERAGDCECANAAAVTSDITTFEDALAELDANQCVHPFACASQQCSYERGYREAELIARCNMNECQVVETMACEEFEENIYGGLVTPARCEMDEDCTLRNDLNPCGCQEGVSQQFPFLAAQAAYDLIAINRERCSFTCEVCPVVTEARCVQNVCVGM